MVEAAAGVVAATVATARLGCLMGVAVVEGARGAWAAALGGMVAVGGAADLAATAGWAAMAEVCKGAVAAAAVAGLAAGDSAAAEKEGAAASAG